MQLIGAKQQQHNMLPLLIIKAGSAYAPMRSKYGDFDKMIIRALPYLKCDIEVVNAQNQPVLKSPDSYAGVIITGAHENVTDRTSWMLYLETWLEKLPEYQVPTLGICFGHQIIAKALGGEIAYSNDGEFGIVEIKLHSTNTSPLTQGLNAKFYAFASHFQSIRVLPKGAVSLAENENEKNHVVKFNNYIYGLQFHPEFNWQIARFYKKKNNQPGFDGDTAMRKSIMKTNGILFQNFMKMCGLPG